MPSLRNNIPVGLVLPFIIIILAEYLILFGLRYYNNRLDYQIGNLRNQLDEKEKNIKNILARNDYYLVFSQSVNMMEILRLKETKSLNFVINRFNQLMPNFIQLDRFSYDSDKNEIIISGYVDSWTNYIRFHNYVNNNPSFTINNFVANLDKEKGYIKFNMNLSLNSNFYNISNKK